MDEDYGPTVQYIVDAIESVSDAGVHYVKDNVSVSIIDFAFGQGSEMDLYARARSGEWASSIVVDTENDEVSRATLRYGVLGLHEGADLFFAKVEVEKVANAADPPIGASSIGEDGKIGVRFRDMSAYKGDLLRREGHDIIHMEVNERVPAREFADWMVRFTRTYRRKKPHIRKRVKELGYNE